MSDIKTENKEFKPGQQPGFRGGPMGGGPMGGGHMGGMAVGKAKDFKGTWKKILNLLKPYKIIIAVVLLFAIGSAVFSIIGPKILGNATTKLFEGAMAKLTGVEGASIDFSGIGRILLNLIGLYAISAIFSFIQSYIMAGVAQKISYNLRRGISEKINRLPVKYFDGTTHGEVLSRVTNDVDTVSQTLNQSMSQIVTSITTLIGVLVMMISISLTMTAASIVIMPMSAIFMVVIIKQSQKYFKMQQEFLGHLNGKVEEVYGGHRIMKAFNAEERTVADFDSVNNKLYGSAWKSQFLSGMMFPIISFIGNIGYVLIAIMGGYLAIRKAIQVGDILAFVQYVRSFTQPIAQAAQTANILQSTAAAAERVFEFMEEPEEVADIEQPVSAENIDGEVVFDHVHFGYEPGKTIINDFNAFIRPGQRVAIVGPTGAGKTTMVKLLMRFYDVESGRILVDGKDIRDYRRDELRREFGMVLQDTWLFNGSIMENIRYGRQEATDEQVKEAAKAAHVHRFVKTLPDGYNMVLNEEASNVSQGEKQLLTIARAILADPRILILDEATSSVDTRTEVLIQKAMENLMHGRTSFIIAHRLSTIKDADLILVMDNGDIVEQGCHEELLKRGGFYAKLYNSQFETGLAA